MKFPKTVQISGKTYKVVTNPKVWGGICKTGKQLIGIGTKRNQSAQRKFGNFLHEVLEANALERSLRYEASDEELVFVMTHKQFDDYARDVATSLWPIVRNNLK